MWISGWSDRGFRLDVEARLFDFRPSYEFVVVAQVELFDGSELVGRIDDMRGYQGVGRCVRQGRAVTRPTGGRCVLGQLGPVGHRHRDSRATVVTATAGFAKSFCRHPLTWVCVWHVPRCGFGLGTREEGEVPMRTRIVVVITALLVAVAIPAWASHGQSSDTDSAYCGSQGWLSASGYGHQWQIHIHDGQSWRAPNAPDWYWDSHSWGFHAGTQYVSVVAGGPSTVASAVCSS